MNRMITVGKDASNDIVLEDTSFDVKIEFYRIDNELFVVNVGNEPVSLKGHILPKNYKIPFNEEDKIIIGENTVLNLKEVLEKLGVNSLVKEVSNNSQSIDYSTKDVSPETIPSQPTIIKSPGLAAVLSCFYIGLGQIYNGKILKGFLLMLATGVLGIFYIISSFSMNTGLSFTLLLCLFCFGVWNVYDAYITAEKINKKGNRS